MTTQLEVANRSLLAVGARTQISSLNPSDGSVEGDCVTTLWQSTFEQLARTAQWGCLRKQVTLSLLQAAQGTPENPSGSVLSTPPTPWLYTYAYPSDCLAVRFIVPSYPANQGGTPVPSTTINNSAGTWLPNGGQIRYEIGIQYTSNNSPYKVIFTNQDMAQAVYTVSEANPGIWDSLFEQAMVASLAAFLVPALSLNFPLMSAQIKNAEACIAIARAADGNEGVTVMDHLPDWMQARAGGQGLGLGFSSSDYNNVCWPGEGFYN